MSYIVKEKTEFWIASRLWLIRTKQMREYRKGIKNVQPGPPELSTPRIKTWMFKFTKETQSSENNGISRNRKSLFIHRSNKVQAKGKLSVGGSLLTHTLLRRPPSCSAEKWLTFHVPGHWPALGWCSNLCVLPKEGAVEPPGCWGKKVRWRV